MFSRSLLASISLACLVSYSAHAADMSAAKPSISRQEFADMLRQTLSDNPEILMEAIQKLQERQQQDSNKLAKMGIEKNKDALFNDTTLPSAGASIKDADVTIVEFFDYHCGYCKHMVPPLTQLLENDKKVRVVFMDYPILSQDSATAARAAVAAHRVDPKKYFAFYSAAMKYNGKFDDTAIANIASTAGISYDKIKAEMQKKEVGDMLQKVRTLGESIGVQGTPAIIIGDKFLPGALSYEELKRTIEEVRNASAKK
jgi:protein-disulfide isomerase